MTIGGYGHYEDDLVKIDGEWFSPSGESTTKASSVGCSAG